MLKNEGKERQSEEGRSILNIRGVQSREKRYTKKLQETTLTGAVNRRVRTRTGRDKKRNLHLSHLKVGARAEGRGGGGLTKGTLSARDEKRKK